ncbi:MAG: Signal-transduction histidine kinase senX3 [Chthoniobacter sp.]|nr:Signal-transduction histidine kinase senX3 [Chthoniobacter sp.]
MSRPSPSAIRIKGRPLRAWPALVLLLLVVLVGTGCVLWFMVEASRNERLAIRQRLADAYRGHLELVQTRVAEAWKQQSAALEEATPSAAEFARIVGENRADSVICLGADGRAVYPRQIAFPTPALARGRTDEAAQSLQSQVRALAHSGEAEAAIRLVVERFSEPLFDRAQDQEGRIIAASAELFALELMRSPTHPQFGRLVDRLAQRLNRYADSVMLSSQRRFLMRELQRLSRAMSFPTETAESLAGRYLEATLGFPRTTSLEPGPLPDVWQMASPTRRAIALFTTAGLRDRLQAMVASQPLPAGVTVSALAPGAEPPGGEDALLIAAPAGTSFPGWRFALTLDDRSLFQTAADRRVSTYLWTGTLMVFVMLALAVVIALAFSRQVRLTELKNDLVATVSHELKTPLTSMRALVDTLLESERIEEVTAREYLQLIAQENSRLSRLIDNFLTFSRLDRNKYAFNFHPIAPASVVDQAVTAAGERCRAPGCKLEVRTAPDLPSIHGDFDALVTALLNLLDNAIKYSGQTRHITLTTRASHRAVQFSVEDNGIGLSPSQQRKVFRRFYQADERLSRSAEGCGLGLSIVQQIATAHGGIVTVSSELQRGSTFTIEIPATPEPAGA